MHVLKRLVHHQDKIQKVTRAFDFIMVPISLVLAYFMDGTGWTVFWVVMAVVSALFAWFQPAQLIRNMIQRKVTRRPAS